MTSSVFEEKIGVTPSVAAPGDTNSSDATGQKFGISKVKLRTLSVSVSI